MPAEKTNEELWEVISELLAEAGARRVIARYMFLCDVPYPVHGGTLEDRIEAIGDCFTEDAVWEGVGGAHAATFGRMEGREAIKGHMRRFYAEVNVTQNFNTHYVCLGQVWATEDGAEGIWPQFQPWIYEDGTSLIRSSRVRVRFREVGGEWKISHYCTENLFIADLPNNWTKSQIDKVLLTR
jgi:ketosteroid isomerase-like protein